ncbi:hypothetical protein [Pseudomonas sp. BF-R-21]|uniref:hypothetical protein n=1 Tax=Pseudomonas sp. BF-R-21 TaxID=2832387 RepID=UPI001CBDF7AD|nr:hypothetical protein [Pseudomonas sp. BF-R-21]
MRLIDFLLAHYGYVRRLHVVDFFGISLPQASLDLANYSALHPENMYFDETTRCWLASDGFKRAYP